VLQGGHGNRRADGGAKLLLRHRAGVWGKGTEADEQEQRDLDYRPPAPGPGSTETVLLSAGRATT
ncbi:MAG TPA: hypothetical protein PLZ94_18750, partial [Armatimonadota bacterium]|nr:hypothetical protein [Armatimonadota bacterium]